MKKIPFTPEGLQNLLTELYLLPQAELQLHADALAESFKFWMIAHFDFSIQNEIYLQGLSASDARYLGAICSFSIEHRCPITLVQRKSSAKSIDPVAKIIRSSSTVEIAVQQEIHKTTSSNKLIFEIF